VKAGRKLTAKRMVKLAGVSRAGFYRFAADAGPGPDPDMGTGGTQFSASRWNGRATAGHGSPQSCGGRGWTVEPEEGLPAHAGKTICCVSGKRKFVVDDRFQP